VIDQLVDAAAGLAPEAVGAIGAAAAFLGILAVSVQLDVLRLRRDLSGAQEELVDAATGLLPRSALRVRLGAELAWAAASRTPLTVAVLRIRGSRFTHAAKVLRHGMREEESAFLLGDQHVAVELWGADAHAAVAATRRLGDDLLAAGHPVVDVGIAASPRDGEDVDTLLTVAHRDLRPIDDPRREHVAGIERVSVTGSLGHATWVLATALPAFVSVAALLLLSWRLIPASIEPVLDGGTRSGSDWAIAVVTLLGLPLGAALLHATCWGLGAGRLPSSRPPVQSGWRTALVIVALVGAPLAWGIFAPEAGAELATAFGATLAVLALVVLTLLHGRHFVHVPIVGLAPVAALGAAITWLAVETSEQPVVANAGRLLAAAAIGALLARLVERASWIVFLALLAGAIDLWSVYAETGVTRQLLESDTKDVGRLLELLLFTGPAIGDIPPFVLGVTDLVFLALFITWAHDWRLDLRVAAGALLLACWAGALTADLTGEVLPLLPFLSGAMVLVIVGRSLLLRSRASAWRRRMSPTLER
jgi:hypothetical protein